MSGDQRRNSWIKHSKYFALFTTVSNQIIGNQVTAIAMRMRHTTADTTNKTRHMEMYVKNTESDKTHGTVGHVYFSNSNSTDTLQCSHAKKKNRNFKKYHM